MCVCVVLLSEKAMSIFSGHIPIRRRCHTGFYPRLMWWCRMLLRSVEEHFVLECLTSLCAVGAW